MNKFNFYLKSIGILFLYFLVCSFLCSILYSYTSITYNTNCFLLFLFTALGFFAINFKNGQMTKKGGYLAGLKLGGGLLLGFFIMSLFSKNYFSLAKFIYYGVLLLVSVIASALGINYQKKN